MKNNNCLELIPLSMIIFIPTVMYHIVKEIKKGESPGVGTYISYAISFFFICPLLWELMKEIIRIKKIKKEMKNPDNIINNYYENK